MKFPAIIAAVMAITQGSVLAQEPDPFRPAQTTYEEAWEAACRQTIIAFPDDCAVGRNAPGRWVPAFVASVDALVPRYRTILDAIKREHIARMNLAYRILRRQGTPEADALVIVQDPVAVRALIDADIGLRRGPPPITIEVR